MSYKYDSLNSISLVSTTHLPLRKFTLHIEPNQSQPLELRVNVLTTLDSRTTQKAIAATHSYRIQAKPKAQVSVPDQTATQWRNLLKRAQHCKLSATAHQPQLTHHEDVSHNGCWKRRWGKSRTATFRMSSARNIL